MPATTDYTRPVTMPATKRDGLANAIQIAINVLESGDSREALLQLVNILDDVTSNSNPYNIDAPRKATKRKK